MVKSFQFMTYLTSGTSAGAFKRMRVATTEPKDKHKCDVDKVQLGSETPEKSIKEATTFIT